MPQAVVKEKKNWMTPVLVALGAVAVGGGVYLLVKKSQPAVPIGQVIQKQSIIYNNGNSRITSNTPLGVQITFKNTGTSSIKPVFRVDIQGTGALDSVLEGQWVSSPSVAANGTRTITVNGVSIPADWQNGKTFNAYVMLQGVDGHWDAAPSLFSVASTSSVTKESVVYNNGLSQINSGASINVAVTWFNNGTGPFQPRFRADIQGTGALDSVLEGQWVTSPSVAVGESLTVEVPSIPIPTDWQNGKTLHAYVMLDGVSGHWDEAAMLFTVVKGGGGGGVGAVSKQSVIYNNNLAPINSGQSLNVQITWKNTGTANITPRFKVDIQGTAALDTPLEGQWVNSPTGTPGGQVVALNVPSIPIPTDWQNGKTLHAYVMLDGVSGHWDEAAMLFTVVKGGGGSTPILAISNPSISYGQRIYFDIQAFHASAVVSLAIGGQTIGSIVADSGGSGAGYYDAYLSAGNYTLVAMDSYGNSASAQFMITAAANPVLSASFTNVTDRVDYTFYNFHPNGIVYVFVNSDNVISSAIANSTGSGSSWFSYFNSPGTYLLTAYDDYGNIASILFTINPGG